MPFDDDTIIPPQLRRLRSDANANITYVNITHSVTKRTVRVPKGSLAGWVKVGYTLDKTGNRTVKKTKHTASPSNESESTA